MPTIQHMEDLQARFDELKKRIDLVRARHIAISSGCALIVLIGCAIGAEHPSARGAHARILNDHFAYHFIEKPVPTAAQCETDAQTWGNRQKYQQYLDAEDKYRDQHKRNPNSTELARLAMAEVFARLKEMTACADIDPKRYRSYSDVTEIYEHIWGDRMVNFLGRHDMWEQFLKEDAEGYR